MSPQSGRRLRRWFFTIPYLTKCPGVMGWNAAALVSHSVPSLLTTTTILHSGTTLSTNTYFPASEKTWANLRGRRKDEKKKLFAKCNLKELKTVWSRLYIEELNFVCFMRICRCLKAPKSQLGLLLNRWSFWYTGKWLKGRSKDLNKVKISLV